MKRVGKGHKIGEYVRKLTYIILCPPPSFKPTPLMPCSNRPRSTLHPPQHTPKLCMGCRIIFLCEDTKNKAKCAVNSSSAFMLLCFASSLIANNHWLVITTDHYQVVLWLNIILNKQDNNFFFFLNTSFEQIVHDPIETSCMYTFSQITHTRSISRKWIQFNCPYNTGYNILNQYVLYSVYHASRIPPMTIILLLYSVMCLIVSVHCTCAVSMGIIHGHNAFFSHKIM